MINKQYIIYGAAAIVIVLLAVNAIPSVLKTVEDISCDKDWVRLDFSGKCNKFGEAATFSYNGHDWVEEQEHRGDWNIFGFMMAEFEVKIIVTYNGSDEEFKINLGERYTGLYADETFNILCDTSINDGGGGNCPNEWTYVSGKPITWDAVLIENGDWNNPKGHWTGTLSEIGLP